MYKEAKNSETDKKRKMLQEDINKLVRKKILSIDSNGIFHLSLDVPVTRKIKNDILLRTIYKIRAKCQGEAYQLILENIIKKMINICCRLAFKYIMEFAMGFTPVD